MSTAARESRPPSLGELSTPGRVAEPGELISHEELQLATRNHGMLLEALRYDVTPPGLHYLLTHYDVPDVDPASWRLRVHGLVDEAVEVGLDDLGALPQREVTVTFECAGNGRARMAPRAQSQPWLVEAVGNASWGGVRLRDLLERAGLGDGAVAVGFTGADHGVERGVEQDYRRGLRLGDALGDDVLVATHMNGLPLLPQHGSPARLVVPGWYGMAQVKWLVDVEVLDRPFEGFQNDVAYRLRSGREGEGEDGEEITRIEPRALLVPPGFPDFYSRRRVVRPGPVAVEGRAWSGWAPVTHVELTTDGGQSWTPAPLGPEPSHPHGWRRWQVTWDAAPGVHLLGARAVDASGREQPVEAAWNKGGFANNSVQRVEVHCVPTPTAIPTPM